MDRTNYKEKIKQIEEKRNSKLLCYVASTRDNVNAQMRQQDIRIIRDHLKENGHTPRIDLLINSYGGDVTFAWRLVHLIREYTEEFNVIVPFNAFSAATLTSFGANSIIMLPEACLGPTDPSSNSPYNPKGNPAGFLPINSEDLASYINFVEKDIGIQSEENKVKALEILTKYDDERKVHPLALGAVKRGSNLAKRYAEELLKMHMDKYRDFRKRRKIVNTFGSELFAHNHPINRTEAKKLGLNVVIENDIEEDIWELFEMYEEELEMREAYSPIFEFKKRYEEEEIPLSIGNSITIERINYELPTIIIESNKLTDIQYQEWQVQGVRVLNNSGPQEQYSWVLENQKWIRN